jgi:hypothetical protein
MKTKINRTLPVSEASIHAEIFRPLTNKDLEECEIKKIKRHER